MEASQCSRISIIYSLPISPCFYINKTMKRYLNPTTGEVMSLNLNSPEIPRFLHPSHQDFFEFLSKPRPDTHRRYLQPLQSSASQLISQSSSKLNCESSLSLPPCADNKIRRSFGQSSIAVKMTMNDSVNCSLSSVSKMKRTFYNNKIFGVKKEVQVPEDTCVPQSGESSFDSNKIYLKPTAISKLVGDLKRSSILMRYDPTFSSKRSISPKKDRVDESVEVEAPLSPAKLPRMSKMSRWRMKQSTAASEFQKVTKIRNTIDDYKEMEQNKHQLDPVSFKNTMSHVLAFDEILKKIKKPVYLKTKPSEA